jgi:ribosomal protein S25
MSHGVKRQRESPEKEAARLEKEQVQVSEYRTLTEDVMTRVRDQVKAADRVSETCMTTRKRHLI